MYKLYRVGDRTEPCGTLACMYLGVYISPSPDTLNFRCERKWLISLIKQVENFNLDNLWSKPGCHVVSKSFQYPRIPKL
jgi:hypothetical protein